METSNASVMDTSMKTYLEDMTRHITEQISASTTRLESLILNQGTEIENLTRENDAMKMKSVINEGRLTRLEKVVVDLKEDLLRTQQHSMSNNLIFQNLPEKATENIHHMLQEYMRSQLNIPEDLLRRIQIARAHRMGHKGKYPRLVVANINEEGRNIIFRHTRNLKGKNSSVYTQMPRELAERKSS